MFLQISNLFLTEITWDENYPYILIKQGPYWIIIAKEDWLLCFRFEHSEILSLRIAKYGKIIFNGLFRKESVFQKTSSILMKVVPYPFPGQKMSRIVFLTVATNFRFLFDFYWHSLLSFISSAIFVGEMIIWNFTSFAGRQS